MKPDLQDLIIAIDRGFASEMVLLEAELIRDGVSRDRIDALLKKHCEDFLIWRAEGLSELRDWLVDCNRKLHWDAEMAIKEFISLEGVDEV